MELLSRISLISGVYHVQVGINDGPDAKPLTPVELEAIAAMGEPIVECGGTFTQIDPAITYTLPGDSRSLPSGFPIKQLFAIADFNNAGARAVLFRNTIETRMTAARDAVTAASQGVTGQTVTIV